MSLEERLVAEQGLVDVDVGRDALHEQLRAEITLIWLTERARASQVAVTDEVRTGLYFIDEVFWDLLPRLYAELDEALEKYYPGLAAKQSGPWLHLASWIGGDRDGNPYVTAEVTAETLRLHRGLAVEKHRQRLGEMARRLSLSGERIPPSEDLLRWFENRRPLPKHVAFLEQRYAHEPYRLALALLADDLAQAGDRAVARQFEPRDQSRVDFAAIGDRGRLGPALYAIRASSWSWRKASSRRRK